MTRQRIVWDRATVRAWRDYRIGNRFACEEYARNRDTIDARYGDGPVQPDPSSDYTLGFGACRVAVSRELVILVEPFETDPLDLDKAEAFAHEVSVGEPVSQGRSGDDVTGDESWFRIYTRR